MNFDGTDKLIYAALIFIASLIIAQIVLLTLKIAGAIASWWIALIPLWIVVVIAIVIAVIVLIIKWVTR